MRKSKFRKGLVFAVIVLFVGAGVVTSLSVSDNLKISNSDDWWDSEWKFRKELVITNAVSDYQMLIEVWKEDGHDDVEEGIIDCENHCNTNFSDIRFIADENVILPYWIENSTEDNYARIWVKTGGQDSIYIYYGNPSANHINNGSETFIFFDDFETYNTDIWDEVDPNNKATISSEDGLLHIAFGTVSGGTSAGIISKNTIATNARIVAKQKGERRNDEWNRPMSLIAKVDLNNYLVNVYRNNGESSNTKKYFREFAYEGTVYTQQYCSEEYPSMTWRILYLKKLQNWQGAGAFTDYYGGNRLGTESASSRAINGAFDVKISARTFDNYLDSYCDWILVAKYVPDEPSWQSFGDEQILEEFYGDLGCDGTLIWTDVKIGKTVTGNFTVKNIGETYSLLDWEIDDFPTWGDWTFIPFNGNDLKPGDGPVTVQVIVVAPDEKDVEFVGNITIVNKENSSDFCTIPVYMKTPVNKNVGYLPFLQFMEKLIQRFPLLQILLCVLEVYVI